MSDASLETRVAAALSASGLLQARICVGLSGGVDSSVLLDVLARLARHHPLRLSAVHVDHGLSARSSEWAAFCRARCQAYGIDLHVAQVRIDARSGIEAAARNARYAVFGGLHVDAVALAHTLDDQLETILLRLNRGTGVHGLSGMPEVRPLTEVMRLVRPLLHVPREAILRHARTHGLAWVEDESNARTDFDRNYVRLELLPRVEARVPGYRQTWSRAVANLADSAELLDELARADAGGAASVDALSVTTLRALTPVRARNLLRWYLANQGIAVPARDRLEEARRQLVDASSARQPQICFGEVRLRRHRDCVRLVSAQPEVPEGWAMTWCGEEDVSLPHGLGVLRFLPMHGQGLSRSRLRDCAVRIVVRSGGERLKLAPERPSRTLKNLLRERGVPVWQRGRLPALSVAGKLAWVARVGVDCRFAARDDEPGVMPHWEGAPR